MRPKLTDGTELIACVTGGTGLVGRRIVSTLLTDGYRVRVLSRKKTCNIKGVSLYQGDFGDEKILAEFLSGAKMVFHCGAELSDESLMWNVNVKGTERVLDSCRAEKIEYFCFISSAGVVGRVASKVVNEDVECWPQNTYERSKLAAEQLVRKGIPGASVVIIRPTNVIDQDKPGALALPIYKGFKNRFKVFVKGAECAHVVHADDVAAAAVYLKSIKFDSPECFFVSCDDEKLNTFSGLWGLYSLASSRGDVLREPISLPLFFPYILRKIFRGSGNIGDVRYSSDKLRALGFNFSYNLRLIVDVMVSRYGR